MNDQFMQPQPLHAISAIFSGWIEPWHDKQVVLILDEWGDLLVQGKPAGTAYDEPICQSDRFPGLINPLRLLQADLAKHDDAYADGVYLQGVWVDETEDMDARMLVHHVMPASSFVRGRDTVQMCLRRRDLDLAIQDGGYDDLWRTPVIPFMTQFGVLDPAKLLDVAMDLKVNQLVLKNSYSFWNIAAQPHRIDGKGGPAWTLWKRDDEDF